MTGRVTKKRWTARGLARQRVKREAWGWTRQVNGKQVKRFNEAWSYQDAMEDLQEQEPGVVLSVVTLGALADQYLAYKLEKGKRSLKEDTRIIRKQLLPYFGAQVDVRKVSAAQIAQYERMRVGKVSVFTVCNELSIMKHMLRLARKWGYVKTVVDIELPRKPEGRQRYLTEEEITRLVAACERSRNPHLAAMVVFALNSGQRKEEIVKVSWAHINFSTAIISLYKTKSGRPRGIPINADLDRVLRALEPDPAKRIGPVFKRADGRAWGAIRTAFTTALERAGISSFRFHDLRHTFSSHYMMRGGSLYDLKEILGHADIKTTARYAHLSPQHLRAGVERMEGLTSAHKSAQSATLEPVAQSKSVDSLAAPVAQVDRAAVS